MTSQTTAGCVRAALVAALALGLGTPLVAADDAWSPKREQARQILEATGVQGGLIVHLGCGDGRLTAALSAGDAYLVHGLDTDETNVDRARSYILAVGFDGRVSVDQLRGRRLPYTDNLVNLLVAEGLGQVGMDEVLRVLCPNGVAYVKEGDTWTKTVKPRPAEIDDWTHYLHGPSGNAVARDSVVGPPRHVQWVGIPRSARQHERLASISAVVSAGGRVFSIEDEGPLASILLPPKWFLVGRDAFNGVILWKKPMDTWEGHLVSFRNGPSDLPRKLVAVGDRVYVTLGYGKPLSVLEAATGKTLKTYEGTEGTAEIVYDDGVLFLVLGDAATGEAAATARRRGSSPPVGNKRILVLRADTGDLVWKKSDADTAQLMPTTLAVSGGRVFFQSPAEVLSLDANTGEELWRAPRPVAVKRPGFSAPTLVVYDDVVFSADRAAPGEVAKDPGKKHKASWVDAPVGELIAFSATTGERLWSCPCRECFNAPVDVLVADGLVWTGELVLSGDPGITAGRDPRTGEIQRRRPADQTFFEVGMPHHRCHRNRATNQYLVLGRAGVEFVDLASGQATPNHWIRGTCQFGTLPSNGLLYVPPHSCACYTRAKLNGFHALAPERSEGRGARGEEDEALRLERRATSGSLAPQPSPLAPHPSDWPTYRHDPSRSGFTTTPVPAELEPAWETDFGGRLSSVTIAEGKVFVASIDDHTVYALNAEDGKTLWQYTTGGRVDSPPTIHQGRALFGSADGWVYCLSARDGSLLWRYRAAPEERRIVSYGQLESVWPVHGSVLVEDDVVWFVAGRSSYLDGGIYLHRLNLKTGAKISETSINSRDPETGRQPKGTVKMFDVPGALPDVLSSDGPAVYMRHVKFDRQGVRQPEGGVHLFCPTGFLDDSWWHRSYWILGSQFYTGYRDWFRAGREVPAGRLLVLDESSVYGYGIQPSYYYWSTPLEYHLFAADKHPKIVPSSKKRPRVPPWGQQEIEHAWSKSVPFQARAMVLAEATLFVAGPPDVLDEEEAMRRRDDAAIEPLLARQTDALEGRSGGVLWAVSAVDGEKLAEYPLAAPPTWDGMAAAGGRLYLSTSDGKVLSFQGR